MIISVKQYFETYVQRCLGNLVKHKKEAFLLFSVRYRSRIDPKVPVMTRLGPTCWERLALITAKMESAEKTRINNT